jgi:hypothetical protein
MARRETPLVVEAYAGCITKCDPKILNVDPPIYAIIGIELIEHLDPEVLLGFERTVFGLIRPPLVILTTPNAEFNEVFKLRPGEFRHPDHRFEWTRDEMRDWCSKVCSQYPSYAFTLEGIADGPAETKALGQVSQMAVFRKNASDNQRLEPLPEHLQGISL